MNIVGDAENDNLQTFIDKPVFVNSELQTPVSLINAAMGRYSDLLLSQVYSLVENQPEKEDALLQHKKLKLKKQQKKITFRKNEIIFKNRKSVMLSLSDVTE